jgi:hypothetical protein
MQRTQPNEKGREARRSARREALETALSWARRLGAAALCLILVWGSLEARARVQAEPRFDLSNWKLELGDPPAWSPEEMRSELAALQIGAAQAGPLNAFSPRLLEQVRAQLLSCAWIREVPRIRLRYPSHSQKRFTGPLALSADPSSGQSASAEERTAGGGIELEMVVRMPIACVAAGGAFYLLDREGVRLGPPLSQERIKQLGYPAIAGGEPRGVRRPPPCGMAWEDRDVREGLEVARTLVDSGVLEEFPALPLETIDISNVAERARRGECEIVLAMGGLKLGWGRSPISPGARTLSVRHMLSNLRKVLRSPRAVSKGELVLLYTSPLVATTLTPAGR